MSVVANTNLASSGAQQQLDRSRAIQSQAIERLSSGLRINSAADDAAGLAISQRMTSQIRGLNVAARNTQDAISLSQTADGALGAITDNLQRMRELSVQAANATNSSGDRAALQNEVQQLVFEIDRVAVSTSFNGVSLLDGSFASAKFQVGAGAGVDQSIGLSSLANVRSSVLGATPSTAPVMPSTTVATGATLTAASTITGAGQLIINGVDIYQGTPVIADAAAIKAAITAANVSGLTAYASPNAAQGNWQAGPPATTTFTINGASNTVSTTGNDQNSDIFFTIISLNTGPGVQATNSASGIQLFAADGRNIVIGVDPGGHIEETGLGGIANGPTGSPGITYSNLVLSYTGTQGLSIGGTKALTLGLTPASAPTGPVLTNPIDTIDISTAAGADSALGAIDTALGTVSGQRATLGAVQNRFEQVVAGIRSESANATAARSRITDADFAAETAKLASASVLQQAASALVAQANALPSSVLTLLRN